MAVANSADFYEEREVDDTLYSIIFSLISDDELSRGAGGRIGSDQVESSDNGWLLDSTSVRSVTGAQAPTFSSGDVGESVSRLKGAANALLASDILVFAADGAAGRGQTTCLDDECSSDVVETSLTLSASAVEFGGPALAYQAIASHRGVSLAEGRGETRIAGTTVDFNAYGGWIQHSFFAIDVGRIAEGLFRRRAHHLQLLGR